MTTLDTTPALVAGVTTGSVTAHRAIPMSRIITTELRKMFDTRSGFWLMASIAILALLATTAVIAFSSNDGMTYSAFTTAISYPMTVVLPIIAVLSVTSEWSQRSGLTTFTLVPHRKRVIANERLAMGISNVDKMEVLVHLSQLLQIDFCAGRDVGLLVGCIPPAIGVGLFNSVADEDFYS